MDVNKTNDKIDHNKSGMEKQDSFDELLSIISSLYNNSKAEVEDLQDQIYKLKNVQSWDFEDIKDKDDYQLACFMIVNRDREPSFREKLADTIGAKKYEQILDMFQQCISDSFHELKISSPSPIDTGSSNRNTIDFPMEQLGEFLDKLGRLKSLVMEEGTDNNFKEQVEGWCEEIFENLKEMGIEECWDEHATDAFRMIPDSSDKSIKRPAWFYKDMLIYKGAIG